MVKNVMRQFNAPLNEHDWAQKWCTEVHNCSASRKLGWKSPNEISEGYTQDISKFWFHFYEPMWYYQRRKSPEDPWKKARWMGFAPNSGDELTYYIKTEGKNPQYLIWSIIVSRRKHVGTDREYVNKDIDQQKEELDAVKLDFLDRDENVFNDPDSEMADESCIPNDDDSGEKDNGNLESGEGNVEGKDEALPIEDEGEGIMEEIYDEMEGAHDDFEFEKIIDHQFEKGMLVFKA